MAERETLFLGPTQHSLAITPDRNVGFWLDYDPEDARALAQALLRKADEAEATPRPAVQ